MSDNLFTKVDAIWIGISIVIGLVGQIVWAMVFWNSPLFVYHWTIAFIGIVIILLWFPYFVFSNIKKFNL